MNDGLDTRGQTLYDFVIGMAVFLLVLGYVFAFLPGLFSPFAPDTDSTPVRADRTVDFLTEDLLIEGETAGVLNESCTEAFFGVTGAAANCAKFGAGFDEDNVVNRAALPNTTTVNVTLVRNGSIAKENGDLLAVGPSPTNVGGRVTRAVRVVSFAGRDYQFVVRIW